MSVPDSYRVAYKGTADPSRQIYAGMLTALDEGIGNITDTLKSTGMYDNSVMVLSNDNGGMSGSYGTASATALVGDACWQQSAASRHRIIVSYVPGCAARIRVGWMCVQAWAAATAAPRAAG